MGSGICRGGWVVVAGLRNFSPGVVGEGVGGECRVSGQADGRVCCRWIDQEGREGDWDQ